MDCRMSSGSKPAVTTGLPYWLAMNSYGRQPITVETWPGPMKPSSRRSGESRMALMAGTIVTWLQNTEKFVSPSRAARSMVIAVDGAVVSNPIAMNTTRLSGFCRAIFSESSGEYTMRMLVPSALASKNDPPLRGQVNGVVHAAHGDHAHRTPGAVHQGDRLGQVVLQAVLVNRVGVPAAHLHQLVLAAGLAQRRDFRGQRVGLAGITEFINEPHCPYSLPF